VHDDVIRVGTSVKGLVVSYTWILIIMLCLKYFSDLFDVIVLFVSRVSRQVSIYSRRSTIKTIAGPTIQTDSGREIIKQGNRPTLYCNDVGTHRLLIA